MIVSKWGNLLDYGFTMIPNLLIDNQHELGISDDELLFIIKVMRHNESYKLHDDQISQDLSSKTIQRRRKTLIDKGYLQVEIYKYQDKEGHWHTDGILYDFTNLTMALTQLEKSEDKKNKTPSGQNWEIESSECPVNNTINNTTYVLGEKSNISPKNEEDEVVDQEDIMDDNGELVETDNKIKIITEEEEKYYSSKQLLNNYIKEFEKRYNRKYNLTITEKYLYDRAPIEFKKSLPYLFQFVDEYKENGSLSEDVTPKLSFFLKVNFRKHQLINYATEQMGMFEQIHYSEELSRKK